MAENCLVRVPLRCFTRIENVGTLQAEEKLHFWPDRVQVRQLAIGERFDLPDFIMDFTSLMPNKSPEPTAVGAVSSAIAVHVASRRWLSFLR